MQDIITSIPQSFLDEFEAEIRGRVPQEKIDAEMRQLNIAKGMQAQGSTHIPEIGQLVAKVDGRLYFRLLAEAGGDPNFIDDFLADNPMLCAPGYRPKQNGTRRGLSFQNGKPL